MKNFSKKRNEKQMIVKKPKTKMKKPSKLNGKNEVSKKKSELSKKSMFL